MKIKWNDDRVRGATTALLLICRHRMSRGEMAALIETSLQDYRADPDGYKRAKATWPAVDDVSALKNDAQVAYYQKLRSDVDRLLVKFVQGKRQFNSLAELDNFLMFSLKDLQ